MAMVSMGTSKCTMKMIERLDIMVKEKKECYVCAMKKLKRWDFMVNEKRCNLSVP